MGTISLQIPVIGQPDTTEDVKLQNSLTTLQTVINGNIDDSNLGSPNNGVPRLLMSSTGQMAGGLTFATGGQNFLVGIGNNIFNPATGSLQVAAWWSAAASWAVARKATTAIVHLGMFVNAVAPNVNVSANLLKVTSVSGTGNLFYAGTNLAGSSTSTITAPVGGAISSAVSSPFTLPTDGAPYVFNINLSGGSGTITTNSLVFFAMELYVYNA